MMFDIPWYYWVIMLGAIASVYNAILQQVWFLYARRQDHRRPTHHHHNPDRDFPTQSVGSLPPDFMYIPKEH